jgi:hypothetical protein
MIWFDSSSHRVVFAIKGEHITDVLTTIRLSLKTMGFIELFILESKESACRYLLFMQEVGITKTYRLLACC